MLRFILRRVGVTMLLTALCLTFVVFFLTNLRPNLEKLAKTQGNVRMTDDAGRQLARPATATPQPLPVQYGEWLGVLPGCVIERDADGNVTRPLRRAAAARRPRRRRFCGVLQGDWGYLHRVPRRRAEIVATRLGADRQADVLGDGADGARRR